ncbi:MAG: hypothetical protein SRB1_02265 [Desulfobacteraceae bacterium Eth-SRB1]|nr:MAG: hypothetical protein SRB1_02265 [Desulfobacteraceae bacterium Eth-SRB1]
MAEGHSIKIMARLIGIDAPETANKRKKMKKIAKKNISDDQRRFVAE